MFERLKSFFRQRPESINGFYRGDTVIVINTDCIYTMHTEIAMQMSKWHQMYWSYGALPNTSHVFTIIDIVPNKMNSKVRSILYLSKIILIIQDNLTNQIFFIDDSGVKFSHGAKYFNKLNMT